MILRSFSFSTKDWSLENLTLGKANLIVGKNSSGKSKALHALGRVVALLTQKTSVGDSEDLAARLVLVDQEDTIDFSIIVKDHRVAHEALMLNGVYIVERTAGEASISGETVSPPDDMLLMHVRRDVRKYPVLEKIIKWSEKAVIRSFTDQISLSREELYDIISGFTAEQKTHLLEMANGVGFPLTMFDTFENAVNDEFPRNPTHPKTNFTKLKLVLVKEKGIDTVLFLDDLSSGMYRTLMLLVLIEQLAGLDNAALIAIDDLGEGLDYSRATKVGRLLFDVCEAHDIQLIATSNEEFMMNIVDISKWNILVREGTVVRSITSDVCPEEFEEFRFSGLSNFDFFTSDFLNRMSSKLFKEQK